MADKKCKQEQVVEITDADNTKNLEAMFQDLEHVITALEGDEVTLEQSFRLYHEGMEMIRICNQSIETIEKKVQVIDQNGEYHEF